MIEAGRLVSVGRRDGTIERVVGEAGYIVRYLDGTSQFVQRKHVQRGVCVRGPILQATAGSALARAWS